MPEYTLVFLELFILVCPMIPCYSILFPSLPYTWYSPSVQHSSPEGSSKATQLLCALNSTQPEVGSCKDYVFLSFSHSNKEYVVFTLLNHPGDNRERCWGDPSIRPSTVLPVQAHDGSGQVNRRGRSCGQERRNYQMTR